MTQTIAQIPTAIALVDFNNWCNFITDGLDLLPDNGDSTQALADDKE